MYYDKVTWLLYLDTSLSSKGVHHMIFSIGLENVCVFTETTDQAVSLITNLTEDARILSDVNGPNVTYRNAFREVQVEYVSMDDDQEDICSLFGRETDWNFLVCTRCPGINITDLLCPPGFAGHLRNVVVLGSMSPQYRKDFETLREIRTEAFSFLPMSIWNKAQVTSLERFRQSPTIMRALMDERSEFLLTNNVVRRLPESVQVQVCRKRNEELLRILHTVPSIKISIHPEDLHKGHAYACIYPSCYTSLFDIVSEWCSLIRAFTEYAPSGDVSSFINKAELDNPSVEVPIGELPGILGLELLIILHQFPELDTSTEFLLDFLCDRRDFRIKFDEAVDKDCDSTIIVTPEPKPLPRRSTSTSDVCLTSRRPASFTTKPV